MKARLTIAGVLLLVGMGWVAGCCGGVMTTEAVLAALISGVRQQCA